MASDRTPPSPQDAPIRAPEIDGALAWLNVDRPLSLAALRGKVVLLDFWTYGCINCMHILPDLKRLEAKYAAELVVIGIHSPKFENEKSTENLRNIIRRYEIHHPVANDADFRIWRAYTIRAWPTRVLIDPAGYIVGAASGEGNSEAFDQAVAAVVSVFDERKELDRRPLPLVLEEAPAAAPLMFPGKVLADPAGGRLFIADSNHNRILICALPGAEGDRAMRAPAAAAGEGAGASEGQADDAARRSAAVTSSDAATGSAASAAAIAAGDDALRVLAVAGTGAAGRLDGRFDSATFHRPQGMALIGDTLFVADMENHAIRALDLSAQTVRTVAGTGKQSQWAGAEGGAALQNSLNSPWDVASYEDRLLFIAMAGSHQIWMLDFVRSLVWPYAGTTREARVDGKVDEAAFAQPSGLAIAGNAMYVADAESNIIRAIDLPPTNMVRTLAGGDLFDFGDVDGRGDEVRLQHPLGVTRSVEHSGQGERLYVADTYNHRLKTLDPATGEVRAFAGDGRPGHADGPAAAARFYEPGGLSATADALFVADTNNHAIRRVDLRTKQVITLRIVGLG